MPLPGFGYNKNGTLLFSERDEALHGGVVKAIVPARHADLGANLWQHVVVGMRGILESLVAMNDQSDHVLSYSLVNALANDCITISFSLRSLSW